MCEPPEHGKSEGHIQGCPAENLVWESERRPRLSYLRKQEEVPASVLLAHCPGSLVQRQHHTLCGEILKCGPRIEAHQLL